MGDGIERLAVAPAAREDGQILGEDQVQLRVGPFEEKAYQPVVHHLHPGHVAKILAQHRKALRPGDGFERMAHILGQHRRAVVEAGLDAQLEHHREAVVGQDHVLGQQAIDGKGFVPAGHTQRFEHQRTQPGGRHAPQRKGVERVEGAETRQPHHAATRGIGAHIVEMGKGFGIARLAPPGQRMGRPCRALRPAEQAQRPETEHALQPVPAGHAPPGRNSLFPGPPGALDARNHPSTHRKRQPPL